MSENYKYLFPLNIGHHKNTFLKLFSCIIPINDHIHTKEKAWSWKAFTHSWIFLYSNYKSKSKGSGSTLTLKTFLNIRKNSVSIKLSFQMGFNLLSSSLCWFLSIYLSQSLFNKVFASLSLVPPEPEVTQQHCIQQKLLHNCIHGLHPPSRGKIPKWPGTALVKSIHGNPHVMASRLAMHSERETYREILTPNPHAPRHQQPMAPMAQFACCLIPTRT